MKTEQFQQLQKAIRLEISDKAQVTWDETDEQQIIFVRPLPFDDTLNRIVFVKLLKLLETTKHLMFTGAETDETGQIMKHQRPYPAITIIIQQ